MALAGHVRNQHIPPPSHPYARRKGRKCGTAQCERLPKCGTYSTYHMVQYVRRSTPYYHRRDFLLRIRTNWLGGRSDCSTASRRLHRSSPITVHPLDGSLGHYCSDPTICMYVRYMYVPTQSVIHTSTENTFPFPSALKPLCFTFELTDILCLVGNSIQRTS